MKKLTTTILNRKGEEKQIFVFVEDETAEVLSQFKDTEIYRQYVIDEYKMQWGDYRAKQHNFSLETAVEENGFDLASENEMEENVFRLNDNEEIRRAIDLLDNVQKAIVQMLFFEEKKPADIARELHISRSAVTQRIQVIYAKLKKLLKNFNS